MAGRSHNTPDGSVAERRLRPIYDWLDNGNNKKALQEAEKVLKKSPTLQAARALKALALLRLGKVSESHAVLDALAEEKPYDDTTLQAMTMSYRESQQLHKVYSLYEAAVKLDPTNEELHSHLFMSYVRVGDYKAQQRAAMALYKFAPKNPYYFWAVMSIVLQAKTSDDPTKRNILLTLAQRMCDNFIAENKMEAEQEVRLYIMILELQEKWQEILTFLEGPLYSRLIPGSMAQTSIPYLKKLGHWRKLNILCKELLIDNQDRWDYYMPYFDSVLQLMQQPPSESDDGETSVDDTAEKCHEFLCSLVESVGSRRILRGPYLARLELWKRLSENGDPTSLLGSGRALCIEYLRVFAHKPCAVPDLRPYLTMIPQKEREEHCKDFLTCLGFDINSTPESTDDIQRHVSCLTLWRLCAEPPSPAAALQLAALLRHHYLRCLRGRKVTSTITEFCVADMYGVMAAHNYFYAAVQQNSSRPIMEALCLLELVLHKSPANFHAKLLLVKLYHVLGNALAADAIYTRLEVKHIQLVSLGWLHCARLGPGLACARALQLLADTRAFHNHHAKDSVEQLTYAYKYGTFEKLQELVWWRRRAARCAGGALAALDAAALALAAGPPAQPPPAQLRSRDSAPDLDDYTDNRDLGVIVSYEPPQCLDPELKSRTLRQEIDFITLKEILVDSILACSKLQESTERSEAAEELRTLASKFDKEMVTFQDKYSVREKICISAPFPARIIAFVNSPVPYRELYPAIFRLVASLATDGERDATLVRLLATASDNLRRDATDKLATEDAAWLVRDTQEEIYNYLELIGIISYVLDVCTDLVNASNKKRSKKKAQSAEEVQTTQLINDVIGEVQNSIKMLEDLFDMWPTYDTNSTFEDAFSNLQISVNYLCPIENRFNQGRNDMINEVQNILKKKSKFLKGIVLH